MGRCDFSGFFTWGKSALQQKSTLSIADVLKNGACNSPLHILKTDLIQIEDGEKILLRNIE